MDFPTTPRSRIRRLPERGHYDEATVHAILDEGTVCHVGIAPEGRPAVIPTLYARIGNEIVLHGAKASRLLKYVRDGGEVCVTVTHVDGIVLARSLFHHSMNYRSAVVFGRGRLIDDDDGKSRALRAISEQLLPGRWDNARKPSPKELNATSVVAVRIEEASAKIRSGPPADEPEDYDLPVWAGVIPVRLRQGPPEADRTRGGVIPIPAYLQEKLEP